MRIFCRFSFLELRSRRSALFPGRSTRSASSNEVDSDDEPLALVDTIDRRRSPTDQSHQKWVKSVQNSLRSIMPAINGTPRRIDTRDSSVAHETGTLALIDMSARVTPPSDQPRNACRKTISTKEEMFLPHRQHLITKGGAGGGNVGWSVATGAPRCYPLSTRLPGAEGPPEGKHGELPWAPPQCYLPSTCSKGLPADRLEAKTH